MDKQTEGPLSRVPKAEQEASMASEGRYPGRGRRAGHRAQKQVFVTDGFPRRSGKGGHLAAGCPIKANQKTKQSRTEPTGCCSLRTGYVAQDGFEIVILLPQLPECWN